METLVYRIAVLRERAERISHDLHRAATHLQELDDELRKLAAEQLPITNGGA